MIEKIDRRKRRIGLWTDPEGLREIDNSKFCFEFKYDEHQHNSWYDPTVYEGEVNTSDIFSCRIITAAAVEADKRRYKRSNYYDNNAHSYYKYSKYSGDGSPTTESSYGGFNLEYGIALDDKFVKTYLFEKPVNVDYEQSSRLCEVCQKGESIAVEHAVNSSESRIILLKNKGTCTSKDIPRGNGSKACELVMEDNYGGGEQIMSLNNPEMVSLVLKKISQSDLTKPSSNLISTEVPGPEISSCESVKHGRCVLNFKIKPKKRVVINGNWIERSKKKSDDNDMLHDKKENEFDVLEEIFNAPLRCEKELRQVVELEECSDILRRAAIDRLTEIAPTPKTALLLDNLFRDIEQNEDVRIRAYKSNIHIRYNILEKPFSTEEKENIKKGINTEPSSRMRWYMSLED